MKQTHCHPERSPAVNEASRQTESKDATFADTGIDTNRGFRIAIRFFDEHGTEQRPGLNREAGTHL